jgi:hypothetical protein
MARRLQEGKRIDSGNGTATEALKEENTRNGTAGRIERLP